MNMKKVYTDIYGNEYWAQVVTIGNGNQYAIYAMLPDVDGNGEYNAIDQFNISDTYPTDFALFNAVSDLDKQLDKEFDGRAYACYHAMESGIDLDVQEYDDAEQSYDDYQDYLETKRTAYYGY